MAFINLQGEGGSGFKDKTVEMGLSKLENGAELSSETIKLQPAKVSFDNDTMDRYTIVLLFAYDRPGLLASIASTFANLQIVLHFAKIDTHLDQAVDVFYVTELGDKKIIDADRLEQIRFALLDAVATQVDTA